MKILCIDDMPDNLTALKAVIQDAFPESVVLTSLNGPRGIELAVAEKPDMIFLDIVMPGMDGFEVCRRLKEDEQTRPIPVVFVTALKSDRDSRIKALDVGADAFLTKPIDEVELTAQVRAMAKIKTANKKQRDEQGRLESLVAERTRELEQSRTETLRLLEELRAENESRKKIEGELRKSEEKYRNIFNNAQIGIFRTRLSDGKVIECNERFARLYGYETREDCMSDFVASEHYVDPRSRQRMLDALMERGSVCDFESSLCDKHNREIWIRFCARAYPDEGYLEGVGHDITREKMAMEALREREEKYRALFDSIVDGVAESDLDGHIVTCNRAYSDMTGHTLEEMQTLCYQDLTPEKWHAVDEKHVRQALTRGYSDPYEKERIRKDGTIFPISMRIWSKIDKSGKPVGLWGIIRDISEQKAADEVRKKLEAEFQQAQKMESVGRLAGGVAHDFNNNLQAIVGFADLAIGQVDKSSRIYKDIDEIRMAAKRSRNIIRQLLAFARKQSISPEVLDLNDALAGMLKMLRRLIGENVDLSWMPGADLWQVNMDPTQVNQILANLVVNARDAIPGVGKVTIGTRNAELDQAYCQVHPGCTPGQYVLLSIGDNGFGMDKDVMEKIFEPFFTTKEMGEGTGLGLATVYGIVSQNNGCIDVESELGKGTTFNLYFRRHRPEKAERQESCPSVDLPTGTETVLLVEDQRSVLEQGRRLLTELGYTVMDAATTDEALRLAHEYEREIDLLITDVIMPGMNGRDLAARILQTRPATRCLYMSGYNADVIADKGVLEEGVQFIQKPFSMWELADKVREAMGSEK
jgi:PAS domain S-box-containing protein